MKIALIGGNGFIGSHLVDKLHKNTSHSLVVYGRFSNSYIKKYKDIEYIEGDFENIGLLRKALFGVDVIVHLLNTTVPQTADMDPLYDIRSNIMGTVNLLEEVAKQKIKRFIYVSSGGTVYGNPEYIPMDEKHPLNPLNAYGISKVSVENYVRLYALKYNFSYIIARPSNPYGPRQSYKGIQGVIPTFMYKLLNNENIEVWGDGSDIRDYIYIDDVSDFFMRAIDSKEQGVFNVGAGEGHSVNDIIKALEMSMSIRANVEYKEISSPSVNKVILDIKKSNKVFNWKPETSLQSGILEQLKWMKKVIKS